MPRIEAVSPLHDRLIDVLDNMEAVAESPELSLLVPLALHVTTTDGVSVSDREWELLCDDDFVAEQVGADLLCVDADLPV